MIRLLSVEIPEYAGRDLSVEQHVLGSRFAIDRYTWTGDEQALIDACADADCILTDFAPFTAHVLAHLNTCKLISVAATGFSSIDVEAAARENISVCAIDEYCTGEVADHTILLILALARKLRYYDQQVQTHKIWKFDTTAGLVRLQHKTLGLIGFGRIGQAVAKRATGFGMRVIATDPIAHAAWANELNVELVDQVQLLAESDIISLHCAAPSDGATVIGEQEFAAMRKRPILINVARGSLIDEGALVNALDLKHISAAGVDVLASESPDLKTSRLPGRDNVILTPHAAFYSDDSILDSRKISAANIRHAIDGEHDQVRKYIHHARQE